MYRFLIALLIITFTLSGAHAATAVYVDCSAPGPAHDGKKWNTAFKTIQAAIDSLRYGGNIYVRQGVYRERVLLKTYCHLYGGFLGYETTLDQRIVGAFPSIIDAGRQGRCVDILAEARCSLDGFTLINGRADYGGGIRCNGNAIPAIRNCRIQQCKATIMGGGVYHGKYSYGSITDTIIQYNKAPQGAGAVIEYHSYPDWFRNVIAYNHATQSGGGIYCPFHSGAFLEYCTLAYNKADISGGAVWTHRGGPVTLNYCILTFNSAPVGGGIHGGDTSTQATWSYCDIYGNEGGDLGGVAYPMPDYMYNFSADPMFLFSDRERFYLSPSSPCASIGAYPLAPVYKLDSIGLAKLLPAGAQVELMGKVVSCVDGDTAYIQEPDRHAGIAVQGLSGCGIGSVVRTLSGTVTTLSNGHKAITASASTLQAGALYPVKPLAVRLSSLASLSGVCVRVCGQVTSVSPAGYIIDDGSCPHTVRSTISPALDSHSTLTGVFTVQDDIVTQ